MGGTTETLRSRSNPLRQNRTVRAGRGTTAIFEGSGQTAWRGRERTAATQHETVRKQLRAIYEKTDTNRQPELIRLLLHLPHNAVR